MKSCINEASAYADMKHSLCSYEAFLRKHEAKRKATLRVPKAPLHRAKHCFIFYALQTRFIEKSRLLSQTAFFLAGAEGKRGHKQLITVLGEAPEENKALEAARLARRRSATIFSSRRRTLG